MIEVVTEFNPASFVDKVREILARGYILKGAECSKNTYDSNYPFIYTAILIKL